MDKRALQTQQAVLAVLQMVADSEDPVPEWLIHVFLQEHMHSGNAHLVMDKFIECGFMTRENDMIGITATGKTTAAKADAALAETGGSNVR